MFIPNQTLSKILGLASKGKRSFLFHMQAFNLINKCSQLIFKTCSQFHCRWGKRTLEDSLTRPARATPLRWGKRSTDSQLYDLYNKRAPLRWGKRAPSRYVS